MQVLLKGTTVYQAHQFRVAMSPTGTPEWGPTAHGPFTVHQVSEGTGAIGILGPLNTAPASRLYVKDGEWIVASEAGALEVLNEEQFRAKYEADPDAPPEEGEPKDEELEKKNTEDQGGQAGESKAGF